MDAEKTVSNPIPKKFSLFRLITDQARIDDDVLNHKYEGSGSVKDPYVVTWIPDDAGNPFNWTKSFRWTISMTVAIECFVTALSSSAFSGTLRELVMHFQASTELITAGISLFVLGFAVGPLVWAPLSEVFGRQPVFFITFAAFTAFSAGCAAESSIATLLVLRFFAGAFGSSPFTNAGGVIADIFPAEERGPAMAIFALAPSMGPTLGPAISGFLSESEGWRWVMVLLAALTGALWILGSFLVPETYAPVLLRKRAKELSKQSGKVYKTKIDIEKGEISVINVLQTAMCRPWILLFKEPIVLVLSIYMSIVYGTLYLLFGAFPVVFQLGRGWSEGFSGLAFLGIALGMVLALIYAGWANKSYIQVVNKNGGMPLPEARLKMCMVGSIAIPVGLFWFAWTNDPSVHWMSPVAAGIPFGFGFNLIFLGITNYLIDAYTIFAASVLAANAVLRSLFGAAFPLFTKDMYSNLGIHWASSVPAFLALACVPAPFVLYKYGAAIRSRCVYASESEKAMLALLLKATEPETNLSSAVQSTPDKQSNAVGVISANTSRTSVESHEKPMHADGRSRSKSDATDPHELMRSISRVESRTQTAPYEASPYDIDRVNTQTSVGGIKPKRSFRDSLFRR